ncbi:Mitochondrial import inner membrane translocase subunit Tim22 [Galdieria sulphuraria]|nr:Mitochondrial import inner membrane translocase subunit Tim22 [Galdieria sulphuraria]
MVTSGMATRTKEEIIIEKAMESCLFKSMMSGVAGDTAVETQGTAKQKLLAGGRVAKNACVRQAKTFALWGTVYSGTECAIEKYRAKHDLWNSLVAGCITGGVLTSQPKIPMGAKARATQMSVGCGGVAMFSLALDYFLEHRE